MLSKPLTPTKLYSCILSVLGREESERNCRISTKILEHDGLEQVNGGRILLVEDNVINQQVAAELLGLVGMQVDVANDGREGVRRLSEHAFDMVFIDIQMPVLDGYEAVKTIRRLESEGSILPPRARGRMPVVAMTANAMVGERQRCLQAGMDDYLAKPIDVDQLYEMVTKWIAPAAGEQPVHAVTGPH